MKVILTQDVNHLGAANEVVSVRPGYARNFLIPSHFAVEASEANLRQLQGRLRAQRIKEQKMIAHLAEATQKLNASTLRIVVRVSAQGKIFGSITTVQIAREINNQLGLHVDRKKIIMSDNITETGLYTAVVEFTPEYKAELKFELIPENT